MTSSEKPLTELDEDYERMLEVAVSCFVVEDVVKDVGGLMTSPKTAGRMALIMRKDESEWLYLWDLNTGLIAAKTNAAVTLKGNLVRDGIPCRTIGTYPLPIYSSLDSAFAHLSLAQGELKFAGTGELENGERYPDLYCLYRDDDGLEHHIEIRNIEPIFDKIELEEAFNAKLPDRAQAASI